MPCTTAKETVIGHLSENMLNKVLQPLKTSNLLYQNAYGHQTLPGGCNQRIAHINKSLAFTRPRDKLKTSPLRVPMAIKPGRMVTYLLVPTHKIM